MVRMRAPPLIPVLALGLLACNGDPHGSPGSPDSRRPPDLGDPDWRPWGEARVADLPPDAPGKGPPYPLVLAHGFFGWDKVGPLEYFHKVRATLQQAGHAVYVTKVDPFNTSIKRGAQLADQVKDILARSGAARVNILAHSQGGIDARYVVHRLPGRVAAVVTIGTPHLGSLLGQTLTDKTPGYTKQLAQAFFKAVSRPFYGDVARDADIVACLGALSPASMTAFNGSYPNVEGVAYYSLGGRSGLSLARTDCAAPRAPAFVSKYDGVRDPIEPLLLITSQFLNQSLLRPVPNDGVVQVRKTRWGTWLGCIPADHFDQVGQILGDSPGLGNSFNHLTFYRELADWLVQQGF
jgi:triacylglycerol lipase